MNANDFFNLSGKNIIVVGGAGRLGSRICESLTEYGASVIIADSSITGAESLARNIYQRTNNQPGVFEVSITKKESVDSMIKFCSSKYGMIHGLVNSAYPRNKNYGRKFEEVEYEDFCENTNLHLGGYFLVSQKILEYYKSVDSGVLLNMSSIYGVSAPRFEIYDNTKMTMPVEYAAIKAGVIHLTKYMAKYYAGNNIRVNALSLGGLEDGQPESFLNAYKSYCLDKGMLNTDDITGAVLFLMSEASKYINGQNIVIDDGFTL